LQRFSFRWDCHTLARRLVAAAFLLSQTAPAKSPIRFTFFDFLLRKQRIRIIKKDFPYVNMIIAFV
jgi:hypothetical protein